MLRSTLFELPLVLLFACLGDASSSLHFDVLTPGRNFPDPCIINVKGVSYVFGTVDGYGNNIPETHNHHFDNPSGWSAVTEAFPTENVPAFGKKGWAVANTSWAPDVNYLADYDGGSYIMYYAPALQSNDTIHCVGVARSKTVTGPYNDTSKAPLICPESAGGAIDAAGFLDDDMKRYVVYKIDGPSIKNGGYCNSPSNPPSYNTSLMLQQVKADDGSTPIGGPVVLYNNDGVKDSYNIEAPDIVKSSDGTYFLFFSSGCTSSNSYTVSYVTSRKSIWGPYSHRKLLLKTGDYGLYGPGGASIDEKTGDMVFHSLYKSNNITAGRVLDTAIISLKGRTASIDK